MGGLGYTEGRSSPLNEGNAAATAAVVAWNKSASVRFSLVNSTFSPTCQHAYTILIEINTGYAKSSFVVYDIEMFLWISLKFHSQINLACILHRQDRWA